MEDTGDRCLASGTPVRRDAFVNEDEHPTSEYGIVVRCWLDDQIDAYDRYVAFFEGGLPAGKPDKRPYVLRYAATSLISLDASAAA